MLKKVVSFINSCRKCGAPNGAGDYYCNKCGEKLD
ncbi:zinc-ribbon domain-containing protein [Evansella sp. LMS18]